MMRLASDGALAADAAADAPHAAPAACDPYAQVRATLSQLDMLAYFPNFVSQQFDDHLLGELALPANDDILREMVPPAGPRLKLRSTIQRTRGTHSGNNTTT